MFLIILTFIAMAETVSAIGASEAVVSLPVCVDSPAEIKKIQNLIKANSKNEHKYDGYKSALSADEDAVLMARLVYAETSAASCPDQNTALVERISEVISNRVAQRGSVRSVVFQRDQFASSLNVYQSSRYLDFLCPKDEVLWKSALLKVQSLLHSANSTNRLSPDTINYFLYKHDPRWVKEPWNLTEDEVQTSPALQRCLRTFKVPSWK